MTDPTNGPGGGWPPGGGGRGDGAEHPPSAPGPSGWLRGVGVVVVAVVIGALLMPSATRPPLSLSSASSPTTTTPSGGTHPRAGTTTTTTTLPTVVPGASAIHVVVANGTTISKLAGGVSTYLRTRGYVTLPAVNATTHVSATQVYAASGQQGAAGTVVSVLGLSAGVIQPPSAVAPVASTGGAAVVVIAGPDLARFGPSTSATTAGPAPG